MTMKTALEDGKGKKPIAVHFHLRPDPLAH